MAICYPSNYQPHPRLHLSLPPEPECFPLGLTPGIIRVRADLDLEAVSIVLVGPDSETEVALAPDHAIGLVMGLVAALDRLIPGRLS
jgi:hypothetical protein